MTVKEMQGIYKVGMKKDKKYCRLKIDSRNSTIRRGIIMLYCCITVAEMMQMSFSDELKRIRQRSFMSQEAFAKEVEVSFSTVSRWESGKTVPNLNAMKKIKDFCERNKFEYNNLEEEWLNLRIDTNE